MHLVYLYGEITQKLAAQSRASCASSAGERPFARAGAHARSERRARAGVRIASVDVGGGTTDLMITTYYAEGTGP